MQTNDSPFLKRKNSSWSGWEHLKTINKSVGNWPEVHGSWSGYSNLDVGQLATPQPCISLRQSGISAAQYIWAGQGRAGMEFKKSQMIYGISYKLFSLCPTVKYTISYRDREMLTAMLFWLEICRRRWSEQLLHTLCM